MLFANWLNVHSKALSQIQFAEVPQCLSSNQGFFNVLLLTSGRRLSPVPTPSLPTKDISPNQSHFSQPKSFLPTKVISPNQSHFSHPSHKSFEAWKAMMTFYCRWTNITGLVVPGLIAPPLTIWYRFCMKTR